MLSHSEQNPGRGCVGAWDSITLDKCLYVWLFEDEVREATAFHLGLKTELEQGIGSWQ